LRLPQRASSPCILAAESRPALASELYAKSVLPLSLSLSLSRTANPKPSRVPSRRWTLQSTRTDPKSPVSRTFYKVWVLLKGCFKRAHNSTQGLFLGFGDEPLSFHQLSNNILFAIFYYYYYYYYYLV
jgi:hypothetical protein